jgi:hypothetical protein
LYTPPVTPPEWGAPEVPTPIVGPKVSLMRRVKS